MARNDARRLNEELDGLIEGLPAWIGRPVRALRDPSWRLVRLPVAILLIAAGFVGFLPVLGFWMIPLGLILIAQDVPFLQRPILAALLWAKRQWRRWRGEG
ncbi:hypothetical protein [Prosthecomicrobium pneumaticum]|uniref:Tryptophan synthase subunit beta n=1 Tax=Prosthecomicrobium pneumaticum TaxID=81895 RepID=A0A7W9FLE1_9HYPH|nr:hypothetical protein [Prosthecomicrobium pneumaticum]MBB5752806.1 hypothetical protein [Prosthecomicrobium pneumaticum]